jgi:hypothetical protein
MSSSSLSSIVERDLVLYSILDRLDGNLHKWPVWSPVGAQSLDPAITVVLGSIMRPAFSSISSASSEHEPYPQLSKL